MRHAIAIVLLVSVVACGGSTAPRPPTAARVAQHLDSLYESACVAGQAQRCNFLAFFVTPPAAGAQPTTISLGAPGGTESWHAFVRETYDTNTSGQPIDSSFIVMAYRDDAFTTGILALVSHVNTSPQVIANLLSADTLVSPQLSGNGTVSTQTVGAACTSTPGLYQDAGVPSAHCTVGTFGVLINVGFADSTWRSVAIGPATINGIREITP